jgi:hypothetical protein
MTYLHIHDGAQVAYDGECPVCAPLLAENPGAIITDGLEADDGTITGSQD